MSIPPAPDSRHPLSNPKETMRREGDQCQGCFKHREHGQTFFRCSGCKLEKYCSTECQKRVWPIHKVKCKRNQASVTAPPSVAECMRGLRKFTDKHRMKIGEPAISALQLHDDASNVERGCLVIVVHARAVARREHSFYATDAAVVRYADMHPAQAADLEVQRRQTDILNREQGHAGTFFVLLQCAEPMACNVAPFGLPMPDELPRREPQWKEQLMTILNEGIVF